MRKQTKFWKTKNGHRLRICDMTDNHLLNTIDMLKRYAKKLALKEWSQLLAYLESDPPEGATQCAENDLFNLEAILFGTDTPDEYNTLELYTRFQISIFNSLLLEKERRGL